LARAAERNRLRHAQQVAEAAEREELAREARQLASQHVDADLRSIPNAAHWWTAPETHSHAAHAANEATQAVVPAVVVAQTPDLEAHELVHPKVFEVLPLTKDDDRTEEGEEERMLLPGKRGQYRVPGHS